MRRTEHNVSTNTPDTSGAADATAPDFVRAALWTVVVLGCLGNMVASFHDNLPVHLTCGVVILLAAGALVARALRARR
ncbi:hypothetical protein GCM10010145_47500 [Streptomyces ruber]|uniref:Uncharacterized protein n=2 Tax=Streptomyces TaxID=1883 RepID=A0A918BIR5_9ACTN|nr:hypothetical protein [Streptomyces ruber]GGQ72397.1 hypothetical protein GCM10010145_47500 [Streptomyces ruber]